MSLGGFVTTASTASVTIVDMKYHVIYIIPMVGGFATASFMSRDEAREFIYYHELNDYTLVNGDILKA